MKRENTEHAMSYRTRELTVREAGRLGGLSTLGRYGLDHYRRAGRKGQAKLNAQFGKAQRILWGSLGGRPKKPMLVGMGEKGQSR